MDCVITETDKLKKEIDSELSLVRMRESDLTFQISVNEKMLGIYQKLIDVNNNMIQTLKHLDLLNKTFLELEATKEINPNASHEHQSLINQQMSRLSELQEVKNGLMKEVLIEF